MYTFLGSNPSSSWIRVSLFLIHVYSKIPFLSLHHVLCDDIMWLQILASQSKSKEVSWGSVLFTTSTHDSTENDQTLQITRCKSIPHHITNYTRDELCNSTSHLTVQWGWVIIQYIAYRQYINIAQPSWQCVFNIIQSVL